MVNTINGTAFLQARLTPVDRIITNTTLTGEIAVGAQNSILIGNIATLGNVTMNSAARGIFNAGAFIQVVPGTQISPTGANGILLTINTLCNGLFFAGDIPNEERFTLAQPVSGADKIEAYPNPFSDKITVRVSLSKAGQATLQLFDFAGRLVQFIDCQSLSQFGSLEEEILLPGIMPGVYFLRLQHAQGIQTVKLVKVE